MNTDLEWRKSTSQEWYTNENVIKSVRNVLGEIELDPASCEFANQIVKAKTFYTASDDGLTKEWNGKIFINPPFKRVKEFKNKLKESDYDEAILLTAGYYDRKWFQEILNEADACCLIRGRLKHYNENVKISQSASNFGHAIFYYGPDVNKFALEFKSYGTVVVRYTC